MTSVFAAGISITGEKLDQPAGHEDWVAQLLRHAERDNFYGSLSFTFQAGAITVARVDQSLKPPS